MGLKPRVNRVCPVCGGTVEARYNRKSCSPECSHRRRMAKQLRRRKQRWPWSYSNAGIKEEWGA